jgi:hypothetical protein
MFLAQGGEAYLSSREVFSKVIRELRTENFIAALYSLLKRPALLEQVKRLAEVQARDAPEP